MVRAAAALFATRAYDGVSVDDLVTHLGVHRNSLYKVFGSKRGLYLAALRWHLEHQLHPLLARAAEAPDPARALAAAGTDLDLLLLAMVERAPADAEVAGEVSRALHRFDDAVARKTTAHTATAHTAAAHTATGSTAAGSTAGGESPLAHALTAAILGLRLRARAGSASDAAGAALLDRLHP